MTAKERYKRNRARVFEIYGIDPSDKRYNCHHIVFKSDTKRGGLERFDVNEKSNLCPMLITEHGRLHAFVTRMELKIKGKHETHRKTRRKRKRRH